MTDSSVLLGSMKPVLLSSTITSCRLLLRTRPSGSGWINAFRRSSVREEELVDAVSAGCSPVLIAEAEELAAAAVADCVCCCEAFWLAAVAIKRTEPDKEPQT